MLRHPDNRNLHFHYDDTFEGLPVMVEKGPFIREYLADLKRTIDLTFDQYSRVLAFRVDLRLPCDIELDDYIDSNEVISRFFASFKSKVKHHREMASRRYQHAHSCKVRYVWAREQGWRGRPHYHLLILLNRDAFYTVGKIASDRANMFSRLNEAWASALGIPADLVVGQVEIPDNATYRVARGKSARGFGDDELGSLFRRASYLCKSATKVYGGSQHGFGCSRG
ncbi:inovirus Gp2 family protein [Pseudomonas sp. PAMC 29040]|uniref:inovirus Gp2 family protein n=1 Tax=Pseudomonas sp. PAMC 29040 TaxID=2498450 RepID=UPI000FB16197|nr:inovirus Gp2 family protein [Pseudomonas sp. PAMC 29040]RUT39800.1 inovirus Gp2 family protein [Pseudomonas sp. PAMC 29040]